MKPIEFSLPLKLTTSLNSRTHWSVKSTATKRERRATALAGRQRLQTINPLLRVVLTRLGPQSMDSDNVAATCKAVRDQIAAELKIDDGSNLITWEYRQERGEYGVRVRIEAIQPTRLVPVE